MRECVHWEPCFVICAIQIKSGSNVDKSNVERGDLSKIVITRNRSGRIIRCKDDDDMGNNERSMRDGSWKRAHEDDVHDIPKRSRVEEPEYRSNRRVFTPPRNAREGEYGSLTVHDNENDLPMTSKSLQERVQARLRAIERRHQLDEGPTVVEAPNGGGIVAEKPREGSFNAGDEYTHNESPRGGFQGHWRGGGGPMNFDRRGGFYRPDYYGGRGGSGGGYFGRGRGRGGPRWRGQWDDYRGRRGGWYPNRYDDRWRDGPPGGGPSGGGGFERRRRRHGSAGRSRSRSRSQASGSRSRSYSRSARSSSASQSPIRPGNRGRVISRARIKTPPLAPLTNAKRSESDENLAELDQFVAQLKAKRQMEHEFHQKHMYMSQLQDQVPPYPGPQSIPSQEEIPSTYDNDYDDRNLNELSRSHMGVNASRDAQNLGDSFDGTDDQLDEEPPEPASPDEDQGYAVDEIAATSPCHRHALSPETEDPTTHPIAT